jgi:hypothetical protein
MKPVPLFAGELEFDETTEVGFPTHDEDGDWLAYVEGDGVAVGDRLAGRLRWTNHPRRRADGTWLPRFGVLKTNDGAEILFAFNGYNQGVTDAFEYEHRAAVAALTLATSTPAYRWVNHVFAVIEADIRRAFECVNEIAAEKEAGLLWRSGRKSARAQYPNRREKACGPVGCHRGLGDG